MSQGPGARRGTRWRQRRDAVHAKRTKRLLARYVQPRLGRRAATHLEENRMHFGLSWSVFTAFCVAVSVYSQTFAGPTKSVVTLFHVIGGVFLMFGFAGLVMTFLVAYRVGPYRPQTRDQETFERLLAVQYRGETLIAKWSILAFQVHGIRNGGGTPLPSLGLSHSGAISKVNDWIEEAEAAVNEMLGEEVATDFRLVSSDREAPDYIVATGTDISWKAAMGRQQWLRERLREDLKHPRPRHMPVALASRSGSPQARPQTPTPC
jgi:hypothetical protein